MMSQGLGEWGILVQLSSDKCENVEGFFEGDLDSKVL